MVAAAKIYEGTHLETWLEGRSQAAVMTVAVRAALRAIPFLLDSPGRIGGKLGIVYLTDPSILRAVLISGVAAVRASPEIRILAEAAAKDANDAIEDVCGTHGDQDHCAHAAASAFSAVEAAASASGAAASAGEAFEDADFAGYLFLKEAGVSYEADNRAHSAVGDGVRADCELLERGGDPLHQPLWPGGSPKIFPEPHLEFLKPKTKGWFRGPHSWRFWHDWYEGYLTGRPLDIDLLTEVATIPSDVWNSRESNVYKQIEAMYEAHLLLRRIFTREG